MSESAPPRIVPYLKMLAPVISFLVVLSEILIPVVYHASQLAYSAWCLLPLDVMYIVMGLVVCFFGGMVRAHYDISTDYYSVNVELSPSIICARTKFLLHSACSGRTIALLSFHHLRDLLAYAVLMCIKLYPGNDGS